MAITISDVEYVAGLAKLSLSQEEKQKFTQELDCILTYVQQLNQVETGDIPATWHIIFMENVWREDRALPSLQTKQALSNAPERKGDYFKVPRVIG